MNTPRVAIRPNPGKTLALDHDWYESSITRDERRRLYDPRIGGQRTGGRGEGGIGGRGRFAGRQLEDWPETYPRRWRTGARRTGQRSRMFVAFTHSGATLALIVGELLASEIDSGEKHPMFSTFRPERFDAQA